MSALRKERIRSAHAAAILGVETRTVQSLALRGELPGAAKIGGTWTFDEAKLRAFILERTSYVPKSKASEPEFRSKQNRDAEKAYEEALQRLRRFGR